MRPVNPYEFRRGAGFPVLFAVAFLVTLFVSLLDFMIGDTAFAIIFMVLAIFNLINLVHVFVTPFARLEDKTIRFYISPALRKNFDLREIDGVETAGRYKIAIRKADGRVENASLYGIDATERERLLQFFARVVDMNRSTIQPSVASSGPLP